MFTENDWWDLVLDIAFVGRLDAERIAAQLEQAQERTGDVGTESRSVERSKAYLNKALELSRLLAAELFQLAKARKRVLSPRTVADIQAAYRCDELGNRDPKQ